VPGSRRIAVADGESIALDWIAPEPGRPLALFIHGFGSHRGGEKSLYFAERFSALGWGYLAFDFRGHGESGGSLRELTLTRLLADLAAVVSWIPDSGAPRLFIGSSMGASVAAWHLLSRPRDAAALAMIGPSLAFPQGWIATLAPAERDDWRRTGARRFHNQWLDVEVGYSLVEDAARYDPARLTRSHRTPSLVLHGMRDETVPWRQSLSWIEECAYPELRLVLIKDGDHRLTAHKAFLFDTILGWWKRSEVG
jgi:pimeloyl-ACP methyl ester carboxylesterase